MSTKKLTTIACTLAVLLSAGLLDAAYSHRQYYSSWHKHPRRSYHYRHYYYKPTPTYSGYKHHYVIYHPHKPKHYYYYNPYKKQYWGRCLAKSEGKPQYSLLAEGDRKGNLEEIEESAFPALAALPPIPESTDGETLDLPPDDLPTEEPAPK